MEKNSVTIHFKDDRVERAEYIARTVGFGEVVARRHFKDNKGRLSVHELQETGVIVVRGKQNCIVTMYIAAPNQASAICYGKVPQRTLAKIEKNQKKGYLKNQPGYKKA